MSFANNPGQLGRKVQTLITSWGDGKEITEGQAVELAATEHFAKEVLAAEPACTQKNTTKQTFSEDTHKVSQEIVASKTKNFGDVVYSANLSDTKPVVTKPVVPENQLVIASDNQAMLAENWRDLLIYTFNIACKR